MESKHRHFLSRTIQMGRQTAENKKTQMWLSVVPKAIKVKMRIHNNCIKKIDSLDIENDH